jgi:hypothetical protein
MNSDHLHKEDWRVLRSALATSLVMRGLSDDEFREKLLEWERTGHIVFTINDETVVVTGGLFCGLPQWGLVRPIAFPAGGTLH